MGAETTNRKPNRLIHEKSPYLLQHAYNPVDWYPWGEEAFTAARRDNKPIFLSIGYSTCHWCHVMAHESFENDEIAAILNADFIAIKVDREERPDIDRVYMTAVQSMTGSGGWPMSVWLTPDLKPFYCGTYFPPTARWGKPGFKELLTRIHDVWEGNRDGINAQAQQITGALQQHLTFATAGKIEWNHDPLRQCLEILRGSYDKTHGGFGGAPKFPRPVVLNFLFRAGGQDMALHTLDAMGDGGLFDQLGGGFHRYSVDERWLVSHFEKMLYDQAQLVVSYAEAYQITHEPFYAEIARRTCDYVLREMTAPDGGFHSAEDADSEGVEGKFYVWTRAEIDKILGDRSEAFCHAYGVTAAGNWEHGLNVLHVAAPVAGLEDCRQRLFAERAKRIRPHRDEKIITAWNGLMISGFCRAAQALTEPRYATAAARAGRYILGQHFKDGRLWRTPTVPGMLEDYAGFASALVDLYETDFDSHWLAKAIELTDQMLARFQDAAAGGFFQTDGHDASVIIRSKDDYDGAEPSGNSVATLLLLRLAEFTGSAAYRSAAERTLAVFGEHIRQAPHAVPQMLCALDWLLAKRRQVVIAGKADAPETQALLGVVRSRFLPHTIVMLAGKESAAVLKWLSAYEPVDGKATAYVCADFTCRLPTNDVDALARSLAN